MSKFQGASSVQKAQAGALGGIELPTQVAETPAPIQEQEAPPPGGSLLDKFRSQGAAPEAAPEAAPIAEDIGAPVQQALDEGIGEIAAEEQRQAIPSLNERAQGGPRLDRWLQQPVAPLRKPNPTIDSQSPDAGMLDRGKAMAANIQSGHMAPVLSARGISSDITAAWKEGAKGPEFAEQIAAEKEGTLLAAMERSNAVVRNEQGHMAPDPRFSMIASVVTENSMAQAAFGEKIESENNSPDAVAAALGEDQGFIQPGNEQGGTRGVTHAEGNASIGQQIHQEWERVQGVQEPSKLPRKEAETLGATFKDMWAQQNDRLVTKAIDPATNQYVYQLSAMGENVMAKSAEDRKRLFPKKHVKPSKMPLEQGYLLGDTGANAVKRSSGAVGKPDFSKTINNAMTNLANVPNVVDKQRAKILFATTLPTLKSGDHNTWQAEINNFGPGKIKKFQAAANQQLLRKAEAEKMGEVFSEEIYSPEANMASIADKIAQEVRSVAQERHGANFLSYNVQGFQGRISPQQSFFDPTTSKAVRFVTRNATPSVAKPGSRVEKNLRQMYAMMLVKGADSKLPDQRDIALSGATPQLEAWGKRLAEALQFSDAQYEAIADAMDKGTPLSDPSFPEIPSFNLDPDKMQS